MELTSSFEETREGRSTTSLFVEFRRVCGGILVGLLAGLLLGFAFQRWDGLYTFVALVAAPLLVVASLWFLTGRQLRRGARLVGASAGWLVTVWAFGVRWFNQFLLSFYHYSPAIVLILWITLAGSLIWIGLVAADRMLLWAVR